MNHSYESVGPKHMKRYRLYSDPCRYKKNCRFGTKCQNLHKDEEKEYFRKRPNGRGNPWRKTMMCENFKDGKCRKAASECENAHGEDDAWCLGCTSHGHFTKKCPENT